MYDKPMSDLLQAALLKALEIYERVLGNLQFYHNATSARERAMTELSSYNLDEGLCKFMLYWSDMQRDLTDDQRLKMRTEFINKLRSVLPSDHRFQQSVMAYLTKVPKDANTVEELIAAITYRREAIERMFFENRKP